MPYSCFFEIIEIVEAENEYLDLKKLIPVLIKHSPRFHKEQEELARRLAERNLNSDPKKFPHRESMEFIAAAIRIAKEKGGDVDSNFQFASRILIYCLQFHLENRLNNDIFKHRDKDKFCDIFERIANCRQFCFNEKDIELLKKCFETAGELILHKSVSLREDFRHAIKRVLSPYLGDIQLDPKPIAIVKKYPDAVSSFRTTFSSIVESKMTSDQVRTSQKSAVDEFDRMMKVFLDDIYLLIGPPPCNFDLMAMGSCGREELCPSSDLEPFILVRERKPEIEDYFALFSDLLDLQFRSLGETKKQDSQEFTCLDPPLKKGLYLDFGKIPSISIVTPREYTALRGKEDSWDPTSFTHTILKSRSLLSEGSSCFAKYQEKFESFNPKIRKADALGYVKKRWSWRKGGIEIFDKELKIKESFVEQLNHLLSDLSLFFEIEETNTLDIVDRLVQKGVFTAKSGLILKDAIASIYQIRVRNHDQELGARDIELNPWEREALERAYILVIQPLHEKLDTVFKRVDHVCESSAIPDGPEKSGDQGSKREVLWNDSTCTYLAEIKEKLSKASLLITPELREVFDGIHDNYVRIANDIFLMQNGDPAIAVSQLAGNIKALTKLNFKTDQLNGVRGFANLCELYNELYNLYKYKLEVKIFEDEFVNVDLLEFGFRYHLNKNSALFISSAKISVEREALDAVTLEESIAEVTMDKEGDSEDGSFTARQKQLAEDMKKASKDFQTFLTYFAHYYESQEFVRFRGFYEDLSGECRLEDFRCHFLQSLRNKGHHASAALLAPIPNADGYRQFTRDREEQLRTTLRSIIDKSPHPFGDIEWAQMSWCSGSGYFRPEILDQLFDENGKFKIVDQDAKNAHPVGRARGQGYDLHFKLMPNQPLMEYAIHSFYSRLTECLSPETELVRMEVKFRGKDPVICPVLISRTVVGKKLEDFSENKLTKQTWMQWSWHILAALITKPGDGRRSNYICTEDFLIYNIDNDISFVDPVIKLLYIKRVVKFHSVLFCLFPNKALNPDVIKEFCRLKPDVILRGWIEDVIKKENIYIALFSDAEERRGFFTEKSRDIFQKQFKGSFTPSILFREGTLATMFLQFWKLQNYLDHLCEQNKRVLPIELLCQMITLREEACIQAPIGVYVGERYKKASLAPTFVARCAQVDPSGGSMSLSESHIACLAGTPTFEEVEDRKKYGPKEASKELFGIFLSVVSDQVFVGKINDLDVIQADFSQFVNIDGRPDIDRQKLMLEAIKHFFNKQVKISLKNCAILETKNLASFLHEDLKYLDLSFCPQIKNKDIEIIREKCPKLLTLRLTGCGKITKIIIRRSDCYDKSFFVNLNVLHIDRCQNLEEIDLESVCLKEVNINDCPKIRNCPKINRWKDVYYKVKLHSLLKPKVQGLESDDFHLPMLGWFPSEHASIIVSENVKEEEMVLALVKKSGYALEFVGEKMQQNPIIVREAVKDDSSAFKFASQALKDDDQFILELIKSCRYESIWGLLNLVRDRIKDSYAMIFEAIKKDGLALMYASEPLRNTEEIVHTAVKRTGCALEYASPELKNNKTIAISAISRDPHAFMYVGEKLKEDPEIVELYNSKKSESERYHYEPYWGGPY